MVISLELSDAGFVALVASYVPAFALLGRLVRGAVPEALPSESYGKVVAVKLVFALLASMVAASSVGFPGISNVVTLFSVPGPGYYVCAFFADIFFLALLWRGEFYGAAKIVLFNVLHLPLLTLAAAVYAAYREQGRTVEMVRKDLPAAEDGVRLGYAVNLMRKVRKPVRGAWEADVKPTNDVRPLPFEEPVYYSPTISGNVLNPHMIIAGSSGAGKTTTVYRLVRELSKNYPVIFVDVKGDVTRALLADGVDSRIVPVSITGLDPFAPKSNERPESDEKAEREGVEELMAAISVVEPVGSRQAHFIRAAYAEIHHSKKPLTYSGIVDVVDRMERESLSQDSRWGPGTRDALFSITSKLKDLSWYLRDGGPSVRHVLGMVLEGDRKSDFPVVVFNLEGVDEKSRAIVLELILRKLAKYLWSRGPLAYLTEKPLVLVVDEAYLVTRPMDKHRGGDSGSVLEEIARAGRSYGAALILVTQRLSDIADGIRQNCDRWVVFRTSSPEDLYVLEIDEAVVREVITQLEKGHAYIRVVTGRRIKGIRYTSEVTATVVGYIFRMERSDLGRWEGAYTACFRCGLLIKDANRCPYCNEAPLLAPPSQDSFGPKVAQEAPEPVKKAGHVDWEAVRAKAMEMCPNDREILSSLSVEQVADFLTNHPKVDGRLYASLGLLRKVGEGEYKLKQPGRALLIAYREVAGK